MKHRLAVVGSRDFASKELVFERLGTIFDKIDVNRDTLTIISGGAQGPDSWAEEFAKDYGIKYVVHLPDWDLHGRSAGYKRNHTIWDDATCGIAFWDGESDGTRHSFKLAREQNKPLRIIELKSYLN